MTEPLEIWMNGHRVAIVEQERNNRLRLSYTETALDRYAAGTPLLSLALPLTRDRYPNAVTRAYLDGFLPEGGPRRAIAADFGLAADDVFNLMAGLGSDCAGALVIRPAQDTPPPAPTTQTAEPLSDDELADLVANLRNAPLGVGRDVRLSLAGVQEKLALTKMTDGRLGRPVNGTPSTHILKPRIERFPNTVENEAFCMRTARNVGLAVANVDTRLIDGNPTLIVERYDRVVDADGTVRRVHQEDFCQAFGLPSDKKYQADGGPSLARIADALSGYADQADAELFLRATILNVALGNGDAHAKNFSLLHEEGERLRLAPLYDLLSTRFYPIDDRLAMYVDDVRKIDGVTAARIVAEGQRWPIAKARVDEIVEDTLERLPDAISKAADQTVGLPPALVDQVTRRLDQLRGA